MFYRRFLIDAGAFFDRRRWSFSQPILSKSNIYIKNTGVYILKIAALRNKG